MVVLEVMLVNAAVSIDDTSCCSVDLPKCYLYESARASNILEAIQTENERLDEGHV